MQQELVSKSPEELAGLIEELQKKVEDLEMERSDMEILLDNTTEHSTEVEAELQEKNEIMERYIRAVDQVTAVAGNIEAGTFELSALDEVALRQDQLGQLARVFQHMAKEVELREKRLVQQVQQLRVEIDQTKKARQVAEITETDYFQNLQARAAKLRNRPRNSEDK